MMEPQLLVVASMDYDFAGGWIYVIMTSSDYNRFKLGRTKGNPLGGRFKDLRTADPGLGLLAAYFVPTDGKLSQVETAVHQQFDGRIPFHDGSLSEWFTGSAKWACQWLESVFEDWSGQPVASMHWFGQGRICRAYEEDLCSLYGPRLPLNAIDDLPM